MAHMLVAGLSGRGLGFRACLKVGCCNQKLFVVGRIHPATLKPLRPSKRLVASPSPNSPPRKFALKCAPPESSFPTPSSSLQDDVVLLSTKDCPDGSILFSFGAPGQQVSEQAAADEFSSETSEADVTTADSNGSVTSDATIEKAEPATVPPMSVSTMEKEASIADETTSDFAAEKEVLEPVLPKDRELKNQAESPANKDAAREVNQEVPAEDSSIATQEEFIESKESITENGLLSLRSGGAILPHPSKVKSGGEDAYVIEGTSWAGVADGVGGWALSGVDSGLYSRELMTNCGLLAKSQNGIPNPKAVIIEGVKKTQAVGTCTAVLAALYEQILYVANVGDSGFIVVRNGKVLKKSTPMQHGFNFPYQIGSEGDNPATAETFEVSVASGDILVLATDGVYDNLYEREIVDVVVSGHKKGVEPNTVALWIVKLANQAGLNVEGRSPFSDAAHAAGYSYEGGKLDDATVVVSYVE